MLTWRRTRCCTRTLIVFSLVMLSGCGRTVDFFGSGVSAAVSNNEEMQRAGCFRVTPDLSCNFLSEYFLRCVRGVYNVVFDGVAHIDDMVTSSCREGNHGDNNNDDSKRRNLRTTDSSDRIRRGLLARGRCTDSNQCQLEEEEHQRQLRKGDGTGDLSMFFSELPDPASSAAPLTHQQRRRALVLSGGADDEMSKAEMTIKALKVCLVYYFPLEAVEEYVRFERMPMSYCYNESHPEATPESDGGTYVHTTEDTVTV